MALWKLAELHRRVTPDQTGNDGKPVGEPPEGGTTGDGEGEKGRSTSKDGKLDPNALVNMDNVPHDEIHNPEPTVANEAGESSTPTAHDRQGTIPIVVMDPIVSPFHKVDATTGAASVAEWTQMLRSVRVSALRLALRRLMQRSDTQGRVGGLRSGRLSGRGVTRLLMGAENVFERRYSQRGEDVAVTLLIDRSGSMAGQCIEQAAVTALLIGETASNANAKLEVVAFDSVYSGEAREALEDTLRTETRTADRWDHGRNTRWGYAEASDVSICKSFSEPIGKLRRLYTTMRRMSQGGTNDASALKWTGERLAKQPAKRKILFVIADGIGDHVNVFRHVVTEIEKQGIIVIGIGIGCNASFTERFTHAVAINKPDDLCGKAFGMLIGTIAKAKGFA